MLARACCLAAVAIVVACKPSKPRSGPGVELETTAKALWAACDKGSAASCTELDRLLDDRDGSAGVVRVQLRSRYTSERLIRRACDAADAQSCYDVAEKLPIRQRRSYLERGCDGGHARSCNDLGDWHMAGHFGLPKPDLAKPAYDKACSLGQQAACSEREKL